MPRSSNDDYMDYYGGSGPSGGPGGSAGSVGQGGLGGSTGSGGRSAGSGRSSGGYGGSGGSDYGNQDAGGRSFNDSPFSGSGVSDYGGDGGSSYGQHGAGNVSTAGSGNRGAPTDAGTDNYFGGSPNRGTDNMGGVSSIGGGLSSRSSRGLGVPGLTDTIGGGLNPGSRSTYGRSEAGGLAVSNAVGRGLGRGISLADAYGQAGRSMAAGGVRGLSGGRNTSGYPTGYGDLSRSLSEVGILGLAAPGAVNVATTSPREVAALMSAIAQWESSKDFSSKYRDRVTDFSDHPRTSKAITSGPNKGKRSSASGAFQFIERTWDSIATKIGVKDFSPRSQTQAAVALAKQAYDRLGSHPNLEAAIEARDFKDISRALGAEWEGVDIRSARSLENAFDRELSSLEPVEITTRTGAEIDSAGQVYDMADGSRVATPSQATFTEQTSKAVPNNFTTEILGYIDPTFTGSITPTAAEVERTTEEYPTPFNTERSGFNVEHDLELRTAPTNVELEDLPGNEHLLAPSTRSRGLGPSSEPKEATFEETYLQTSTETAPPNAPAPQQRGDTTIRDVVVPDDWQRPSTDPWAGMREGDVGYANSPQGDPWGDLRDAMAESGIEGLPFKPVAAAVDAALSFIPGIGWVNLGAKLVTGETIGEYVARNGIKTEITFPSVGEPGSDEAPPLYRSETANENAESGPDEEHFERIYLNGNSNPSPAVKWGRRAA